jgi:Ni,Fe-hydrogenase III large subunit/Ni,Fe-hydrogenase III component G
MELTALAARLADELGEGVRIWPEPAARIVHVGVPPDRLPAVCAHLSAAYQAPLSVMTGTDERPLGRGFGLYYLFSMDPADQFVAVETMLDGAHTAYPSVTPVVPAAHWYEREVKDMLGLDPVGHPDPRRLVLHPDWPRGQHPLRKDFDPARRLPRVEHADGPITGVHGEGVMEIPVGPIHAGIIEPGHFRFGAVGELMLHLEARLFYTHRGIEKAAEGQSSERVLFLAERICGACSLSHSTAYCQALEQLAGVAVPLRAQVIRTILLELERLYNHIGDIGNLCAGTGFQLGVYQGGRLKELLQQSIERVTGSRFFFGVNWPGGVRRDLTAAHTVDIGHTIGLVERDFRDYILTLLDTDSFMERLTGTGVLAPAIARELGAVGVAARASGVDRDSRVLHPYAAYDPAHIKVPVYQEGDVKARVRVRSNESLVSFALVRDLLTRLEPGELAVPLGPLPAEHWAIGLTESPRGENIHWVMTGREGEIYRYRVRSASYNWAVVPFAVPGNMLPDFPLINKSFELCYACLDR